MEPTQVLEAIRRIVDEAWAENKLPVFLSSLPRKLVDALGSDYKSALGDKGLKAFLKENSAEAGVRLVQDPLHAARVGVVPLGEDFVFSPLVASSSQISAADARAFARVLGAMTVEEQRSVALPVTFVTRLLAAR